MKDHYLNLAKVLSQSSCAVGTTPAGLAGHDVQFYRSEQSLVESVVDFLSEGIRVGQPIIVIATPAHRRAFGDGLRARNLDPDQLFAGRLAIWLDARETLNSFMEEGVPNRDMFMATVGSVFERLLDKRHYLVVRAFGEMVDLLWKAGNVDGAISLEKHWNELAMRYKYSLLCGYSIDNFVAEAGVAGFRRVCDHHSSARLLDGPQQNVA
ncbi:MAG TPA: MEDS domain-containing protein [Gemmatimonadaceae bacterium]|nr:MEDS domain-containing protein [Gemmatimonadaceae bacterium]